MSRRTKIIITTILLLIVVAVIFWLIWALLAGRRAPPTVSVEETGVPATETTVPGNLTQTRPAPLTAVSRENEGTTLSPISFTALSRSFAERYGSYSNQSDFSNIKELYPFMTASLRAAMQELIEREGASLAPQQDYVGVTTRATGVRVISTSSTRAEVLVNTQRSESVQDQPDRVYYQNLKLTLVTEGGQWKVDNVVWE